MPPQRHRRRGWHPLLASAGLALATATLAALAGAPSAMLAQGEDAEPLPSPGSALPAGRYSSDAVGPRIEFRVEDGWLVGPSGTGPIFTLERSEQPGTVLSFTRFDGDVFLDSCDPSSLSSVEATVPRLLEVIAGNPYLNPGPPEQIEVDGYAGAWMDVATPPYEECQLRWLLIWGLPVEEGGEFVQVAGQQARFIALDVDGEVVVVAIESLPGVPFGGLLQSSLELVDTMRIEPGASPVPAPDASPGASAAASAEASAAASLEPATGASAAPGPAASPSQAPRTPTPADPGPSPAAPQEA